MRTDVDQGEAGDRFVPPLEPPLPVPLVEAAARRLAPGIVEVEIRTRVTAAVSLRTSPAPMPGQEWECARASVTPPEGYDPHGEPFRVTLTLHAPEQAGPLYLRVSPEWMDSAATRAAHVVYLTARAAGQPGHEPPSDWRGPDAVQVQTGGEQDYPPPHVRPPLPPVLDGQGEQSADDPAEIAL